MTRYGGLDPIVARLISMFVFGNGPRPWLLNRSLTFRAQSGGPLFAEYLRFRCRQRRRQTASISASMPGLVETVQVVHDFSGAGRDGGHGGSGWVFNFTSLEILRVSAASRHRLDTPFWRRVSGLTIWSSNDHIFP